jgi:hypothetical protein
MPKSNLKTQSKRLREFAKQDKRRAKDEKRALRKAENRAAEAGSNGTPVVPEVKVASVAPRPPAPRVHTQRIISTGIPVRKPRA